MKSGESEEKKHHHHHHRHHKNKSVTIDRSLNSPKIPIPENFSTPTPKSFNSSSRASSFNNISAGSPRSNMQETILKLHTIIEEKSNLIQIQKERIEKLNIKLSENQKTISQLQQDYQEHQSSLSQLQLQNQTLQQTFAELKANYKNTDDESQIINEKLRDIDLETEKINKDNLFYEQKISQYLTDNSANDQRIESALAAKNLLIEDNDKIKNQIAKLEIYKEQCPEFESRIPEIQERVNQLQEDVNLRNSLVMNNKTQIDQLTQENSLLKEQNDQEIKILNISRNNYSKLKLELETKVDLLNEINILQDNLLKNQHFINEVGTEIQNEDQYLTTLKNFNKQRYQEKLDIKNYLNTLEEEMEKVKCQVYQLSMENNNRKSTLNGNIEAYVNPKLEKSQAKIMVLNERENLMKKEIEEMRKIVAKLEKDVDGILFSTKKICDDQIEVPPEMVSTFEFSKTNFSNLGESVQNVENNNYVISSLIEENSNIKNSVANARDDNSPSLPKQSLQVRAAKYGLY